MLKNSKCISSNTKIEPLRNDYNLEPSSFPESLSALNAITSGAIPKFPLPSPSPPLFQYADSNKNNFPVDELMKLINFYELDSEGLDIRGMKRCLAEQIGIAKKIRDKFLTG